MKHLNRLLIFGFLAIFSSFQLLAQTGTIKGRVLDDNNLPLPGAYVTYGELSTSSDNDGYNFEGKHLKAQNFKYIDFRKIQQLLDASL